MPYYPAPRGQSPRAPKGRKSSSPPPAWLWPGATSFARRTKDNNNSILVNIKLLIKELKDKNVITQDARELIQKIGAQTGR